MNFPQSLSAINSKAEEPFFWVLDFIDSDEHPWFVSLWALVFVFVPMAGLCATAIFFAAILTLPFAPFYFGYKILRRKRNE